MIIFENHEAIFALASPLGDFLEWIKYRCIFF